MIRRGAHSVWVLRRISYARKAAHPGASALCAPALCILALRIPALWRTVASRMSIL